MGIFPLLALSALLQNERPTAMFRLRTADAVVGKGLEGTLFLTIPEGLHGYQNPPSDEFENPITLRVTGKEFKLFNIRYPTGRDFKMTGAEKPSKVYEGAIEIPFYLIPTKPGRSSVEFEIAYQFCNATSCFPPDTLRIAFPAKPILVAPAPKKAKA